MPIIEGAGLGHALQNAGVPVAGTDEVQTVTIGGTPETGSTFRITFDGWTTGPIAWVNVNTTLRDNVDAALEALPNIGTGGVTTAVGTMTAGVGTLTLTFAGTNTAKKAQPLAVGGSFLQSNGAASAGTIGIAETTPGVDGTARSSPKGALVLDTTNGKLYINTGSAQAPTWTVVGSQS